ncbi:DUF5689 domain-containing protein [Marixanthomonas spongiae]|uniref:DUF5689 domain-containing protein n=1 Tax=Marixanthomonas spongiae TaxID=2174845 RepID=A0A2U0HZ24_9FLAO|nr:DUF5689 domain-containing protein [Marixanthomonas spongiae]PVW14113.1 hypothetical protein DDV96_09860 [Marixanthomonas spongiae]
MKAIKNLSLLFLLGLIVVSCVKDDDYDIPEINVDEPDVDVNFTIQNVKDVYRGFEPVLIEAGEDSETPLFIEAYVVSSDESGNFYKQLIIQDSPENPTAGISISTQATDLYTKYEPGRKIYFRVDGLYSGVYADLPTLGTQDGDEVGRIGVDEFNSRIFRSQEVADLVPKEVSISQASSSSSLLNTLVKFSEVEFADEELGESYGNIDDTFSVNRSVVNCDNDEIIMRTSGFSDFKNLSLPEGNGMLTAVLSTFNGTNQLFIRNPDDVMFDGERCDDGSGGGTGEGFECTTPSGGGTAFFNVDFEEFNAIEDYVDAGWTNVNVAGGGTVWEIGNFESNNYAQISGFNSGEDEIASWLVTPEIDMDNTTGEELSFDVQASFDNGTILSVVFSTNFTGDVTTADWQTLSAVNIPTGPDDGFGNFQSVGPVNISCIDGPIHIAFLYEGSDPDATTRYHVDNIKITGN